jgi:hypothetical protein
LPVKRVHKLLQECGDAEGLGKSVQNEMEREEQLVEGLMSMGTETRCLDFAGGRDLYDVPYSCSKCSLYDTVHNIDRYLVMESDAPQCVDCFYADCTDIPSIYNNQSFQHESDYGMLEYDGTGLNKSL